jgi:hypothetical protein
VGGEVELKQISKKLCFNSKPLISKGQRALQSKNTYI